MLFYLLCCFVIVTRAYPEKDIISEKGTVPDKGQGRISGGEVSPIENPFQVQITREGAQFCSGAIFNERYILTAAHCVEDAKPEDVTVRAGSRFLGQGIVIPITQIVQHPDYDYPQYNFDIAYMRTMDTLVFDYNLDPFLAPVYIYDEDDELPHDLEIDGWGIQGRDGKMQLSEELREVVLPIMRNVQCQLYSRAILTKNMICGYRLRDISQGACKGDGGGPAVVEGQRRLLGISSFTDGCGPGMGPSVFTFVQAREIHDFIINGTRLDENASERSGHHNPGRPERPPKRP